MQKTTDTIITNIERIMTDNFIPFWLFVIAMVSTPGPGNLTLMAIGQTTGFKSAIPFLIGAVTSFTLLNFLVAVGLGKVFTLFPLASNMLKILGTGYILYLAYNILRLQVRESGVQKRFTFVEGLLVHPLSPKSWAMSVTAFSQFTQPSDPRVLTVTIFVMTFFCHQVFFHSLWCAAGSVLFETLRKDAVRKAVGGALSGLMVTATIWALFA